MPFGAPPREPRASHAPESAPHDVAFATLMRHDLEEMLFRLAERAHGEPKLRARLVTAIRLVMRASIAEKARGRDGLYQSLRGIARRWARWRAPRLMRALDVDPRDARDLGRIQDWEDELLGVTGHWVPGATDGCAIKRETACPFADLAAKDPEICTELVHELESETFRALNPAYRLVPLTTLLSKGAAHCEFRHEIRDSAAADLSAPVAEEMNQRDGT